MTDWTRRRAIRGGGGLLAVALAGCTGDGTDEDDGEGTTATAPDGTAGDGSDGDEDTTATSAETTTGSGDDTRAMTTDGGDLDLREANVTGVDVSASDGGDYRFAVTLFHDDDGEDGYANWWQVETLGGERLGRRDLLHAHGTRKFTRSATITVPDDVDCVVVRGHDQTHGYGGQAMTVAVSDGATTAVRQGSEPRAVDETDCP